MFSRLKVEEKTRKREEQNKGRERGKDYWAVICAYKATSIFTSSVHKGTLVINICDRCAGRHFLEDMEAQLQIKPFTRYCQNSSNCVLEDNCTICKLKSCVMKSREEERENPVYLQFISFAKVNSGWNTISPLAPIIMQY